MITSRVTRFAPSPTGELHLGHVAHAAWVWGVAAARGARVVIRIEDHDQGRSSSEYEHRLLEHLAWLGLMPDRKSLASLTSGNPSHWRQSDCDQVYREQLGRLEAQGLVYGCDCSRSVIAAELGDGVVDGAELRYPGTCRDRGLQPGTGVGLRVRLPDDEIVFNDIRLGPHRQRPSSQCGDLLVRDRRGQWTYQFAVVVDDLRHGVSLVIRGDDLLGSTGRQILLARMLGRETPVEVLHHPLLFGPTGAKLGKREQSQSLSALRATGATPADLLGRALHLTGRQNASRPVPVEELAHLFRQFG